VTARVGIVVGIDGLGKTPLIELMRQLDPSIEVRCLIKPDEDPRRLRPKETLKRAFVEVAEWQRLGDDKTIIYDRFPWPDEFVYGGLAIDEFEMFDFFFSNLPRPPRAIYIYPHSMPVYTTMMARCPDPYFSTHDPHVYGLIMQRYNFWREHTRIRIYSFATEWFTEFQARLALNYICDDGLLSKGVPTLEPATTED
jgi:hypothetical protein